MRNTPLWLRRLVVGGVSALTVGGVGLVALAPAASATSSFTLSRLAGANRFASAATISTFTFPSGANTVLLASGVNFPDALSGAYLAGNENGGAGAPILLTNTDSVPSETLAALSSLKAKNVIILGGTAAVSAAVETALSSTASTASGGGTLTVTRVAGPTRFDTNQAVNTQAGADTVGTDAAGAKTAILATGLNFPDALGAGALAYAKHFPLLLTGSASTVSSQALSVISTDAITNVIVVGGTGVVPASQVTQLQGMGITVTREAGPDRSATSAALAADELANFGFSKTHFNVANGFDPSFPASPGVPAGFSSDALAGSPHSGAEKAPTLITDSPTSAASVITFATDNAATETSGHIFGGTSAVADATGEAIETAAGNTSAPVPGSATSTTAPVTLTSASVAPGGTLSGTVANPSQFSAISVTGCGLASAGQAVSPSSTGAFSLTVPTTQAAGTCDLVFTFTGTNGTTSTQTVPVTVTAPIAATSLPTLTGASILGTAIAGNNTGAPVGTTVQYVFDQSLTGDVLAPTGFHVYASSSTEYTGATGNAKVDATNPNAVDVFYPDTALQTTAGAATLSLATVSTPAVTSVSTGTNPDGSEPIGTASTSTLTAGVTTAPDLVSAVATGAANTTLFPDMTAVNLTFNKPAYVTATGGVLGTATTGFSLVLSDGTLSFCTPPGAGSTTASGGIVPGGNGTTTLTVVCTNDATSLTTALTTGTIARAIDAADSVSTAASGGVTNQAEATSSPNTVVAGFPELTGVAVHLKVGASGTTDSIVYTFDAPVTIPTVTTGFNAITSAAGLVTGGTVDTAASTTTSIVIDYTDPALATVVGGSVNAGTVTSTNVSGKTNLFNELGATNPSSTSVTPGIVAAPQLTAAAVAAFTNTAGVSVNGIQYTFSQPVVTTGAVLTGAGLHAYDADGTELNCTAATATGSTVLCTTFVTTATGTPAATAAQVNSATLGTADNGAVTGLTAPDNNPNPEGAAAI